MDLKNNTAKYESLSFKIYTDESGNKFIKCTRIPIEPTDKDPATFSFTIEEFNMLKYSISGILNLKESKARA